MSKPFDQTPRSTLQSEVFELPHLPIPMVPGQKLIFGRNAKSSPGCRFVNPPDGVGLDMRISQTHATVEVGSDGNIYVTDNSTNGTFVDGVRLVKDQKTLLNPQSTLILAELEPRPDARPAPKYRLVPPSMDCSAKYEPMRELGSGAFGRVDLFRDRVTGVEVAIKRVDKLRMQRKDPRLVEHLNRERSSLAAAAHPHVVRLIDHYDSPTAFDFVMEYVGGGSLLQVIMQQIEERSTAHKAAQAAAVAKGQPPPSAPTGPTMPWDVVRCMCWQLASAVRYLHDEVKLAHRDLKPDNILVVSPTSGTQATARAYAISKGMPVRNDRVEVPDGFAGALQPDGKILMKNGSDGMMIKLADFGMAKPTDQLFTAKVGTYRYMPPEVMEPGPGRPQYTAACDVWSLAMMFCTLFIGFMPPNDILINFYRSSARNGKAGSFRDFATSDRTYSPVFSSTPSDAMELLEFMLAFEPDRRPTMTEVLQHPFLRDSGLYVAPDEIFEAAVRGTLADASAPAKAKLGDLSTPPGSDNGATPMVKGRASSLRTEKAGGAGSVSA